MPIVNITVVNDDVLNTPIQNAAVAIYTSGAVFVTTGLTNSSGLVSFNLPSAIYHVYLYKQGVNLVQPQILDATEMATVINYELTAHERSLPETIDPELIRVSGYIKDSSGAPKREIYLNLYHEYTQLNANNIIESSPVHFTSDKEGYFQFDLYRNMQYCFPYLTERPLFDVRTPDRPAIKITELLFYVPVLLEVSSTTITVPLNNSTNVPYTLTYSDYSTDRGFCSYWGEVVWTTSNQNIVIGVDKERLTITRLQAGTTTVTFERKFKHCLRWENPPSFVSPTLTIS